MAGKDLCGLAQEQPKCPGEARPHDSSIAEVFGHPGKRTQVRSVDRLPPLEIVLEVRGSQAIPSNFRAIAQRAVRSITDYLSRAQIISRRFTINMLESKNLK